MLWRCFGRRRKLRYQYDWLKGGKRCQFRLFRRHLSLQPLVCLRVKGVPKRVQFCLALAFDHFRNLKKWNSKDSSPISRPRKINLKVPFGIENQLGSSKGYEGEITVRSIMDPTFFPSRFEEFPLLSKRYLAGKQILSRLQCIQQNLLQWLKSRNQG